MPEILQMVTTHCPICKGRIDCSDMKRCPLALAKWKGEIISPEHFAESFGEKLKIKQKIIPTANKAGQFDLF